MQTVTIILFKSIICSGILFLYYLLFLKNKKLHLYNRFYLLATVVVSLIIPFLHFEWYTVSAQKSNTAFTILKTISSGDEEKIIPQAASYVTAERIIWLGYTIISLALFSLLLIRIVWIYKIKRRNRTERLNGFTLVHTNLDKAPFSFLKDLFWKDTINIESETGKQIVRHELVHIKQLHTLDKLFVQIVLVISWMNPFYWLIQKEISLVHEFIADQDAIEDNDAESFARMLLQSHYAGAYPGIIQPFFYSPIKRRLTMLTNSKTTNYSYLRRLLVLPLLGIALFLFSFSLKKNVSVNRSDKKIIMVLDAGHGGKDNGVTGVNGMPEKDIALKITQKISSLAEAYNITVIPTRNDDAYPTLAQRAEKVKESSAKLLVSIHINDDHGIVNSNGYEVIVDRRVENKIESIMLASAIISKLQLMNIQPRLIEKGLYVLNNAGVPAVLIECGYINSQQEMEVVNKDEKLEQFCRNILSGVVDYEKSLKN